MENKLELKEGYPTEPGIYYINTDKEIYFTMHIEDSSIKLYNNLHEFKISGYKNGQINIILFKANVVIDKDIMFINIKDWITEKYIITSYVKLIQLEEN